jgi:hypothetical protein
MNTVICAGGTGTRMLEAMLHLCAAGLGPNLLRVLVIDPDRSNGNGDRATALVERYREGHRLFAKTLSGEFGFFRTELDLLDVGREVGLKIWSPVGPNDRLQDLLKIKLLRGSTTPEDVWRLFFTQQELEMDLKEGFRARPSVGAAAMSLVAREADRAPWNLLLQRIQNDMNGEQGARVFLTGSIFGGTGAATLFPIARFLRERLHGTRLRVAACPVSPYFQFAESAASVSQPVAADAARSEDFPTHSKGAVDFYRFLERHVAPPFDVLFWIGDNSPRALDYAPGGRSQRNPAHLVELLGALAGLEFFSAPEALSGSCYAAAEQRPGGGGEETVSIDWSDLPLIRTLHEDFKRKVLRFWLTGVAHLGFAGPLVRHPEIDRQPLLVPWYWQCFARHKHSLSGEKQRLALDFLDSFFASSHFPWWQQIHSDESVHLGNRVAFPADGVCRLDRLCNLYWPDRAAAADPDAIDRFYSDLCTVTERGGGTTPEALYLAQLAHAADKFAEREYRRNSTEES